MLFQIIIGSIVIFATVFVQAGCIRGLETILRRIDAWIYGSHGFLRNSLTLTLIVLWLVIGLVITSWLWAYVYLWVGALDTLEESLYFSIVTFATLGYGDIVLDEKWRILGSITALNGLVLVGLNTAYLAQTFGAILAKHKHYIYQQNKKGTQPDEH